MSKYNHQQSSYCYSGTDILKNKHDIRSLAYANGYRLEWERTNPQQLLKASIRSSSNIDSLTQHIHTCLANKTASSAIARQYKTHTQKFVE